VRRELGFYIPEDSILHIHPREDVKSSFIFFHFIYWAGVETNLLLPQPFIVLVYQPWMIDDDVCGTIDGMNDWQGKPTPSPLCAIYFPHDLARARTRVTAKGSRRLTD
jgi:hypothetical protein